MDKLYKIQKQFNIDFFKKKYNLDIDKLTEEQKILYTKDFILHCSRELFEVLNELPFKMHRKNIKDIIRKNVVDELIDTQKFLWGVFQIWGINEKEFSEEFIRKSNVVKQRYDQEFEIDKKIKNKKVIILDIDGVIAKYPEGFIDFINIKTGNYFNNMYEVKNCISVQRRYELKEDYRLSGIKKNLDVREGAIEFINEISKKYAVVLLSSRPYNKYSCIYPDTLEWLDKNNIKCDLIIWDERKDRSILKNFSLDKIKFIVEDNLYFANKMSQLNILVYLVDNIYNQNQVELKNVKRVRSFEEIILYEKIN